MADHLQTRFAEFEKTLRLIESTDQLIAKSTRPRTASEYSEQILSEVKVLAAEKQALVTEAFRLETIGLSCEREKRRIKGIDRKVARLLDRSRQFTRTMSAGVNEGSTRNADGDAKAIVNEAKIQRKLSAFKFAYVLMLVAANVVFLWLFIKFILWISN